MAVQCEIKRFWIDRADRDQALQTADEINGTIYKTSHQNSAYGFAKAVCQVNGKWGVRVMQADFSKGAKFKSIKDAKVTVLTPVGDKELEPLLISIKALIDTLASNPHDIVKPDDVIRRLNKLVVYLVLAREWPYKTDITSIASVIGVVDRYKGLFSKKDLTPPNQVKFKNYLSQLSKHLHLQSLSLADISVKIMKCTQKQAPMGSSLFEKLQGLIKKGTDRILWPSPSTAKSVGEFCRVFARHTYVYKPDADNVQAREKLQAAVDRLVTHLVSFDRDHKSSTVFGFMIDLAKAIDGHYKKFQNGKLETLAPLVWAFEALVKNEGCVKCLRASALIQAQKDQKIPELFADLFVHEASWKAVCQYVVNLGNAELFDTVVLKRIDPASPVCLIAEDQLNTIFLHLNNRFDQEEDVAVRKEYKKMFQNFLEKLADADQLHLLKPYAKFPDHARILRKNLVELGFQVMQDETMDLELLFGNAAFRSLKRSEMDHGDMVRRSLLRLFTKFGPNKIVSQKDFNRALGECVKDFSREYEHLAEEVLSQIGKSTPPGVDKTPARKLIPVESWLSDSVLPIYRAIKSLVLKCLPLEWKETTFNGEENLLNRVAVDNGELYLLDYKDGGWVFLPIDEDVVAEARPAPPKTLFTSTRRDVKAGLKRQFEDVRNQQAVSHLTEVFVSSSRHKAVKEAMDELLKVLFAKMREDSATQFHERLTTLATFLHDVSPFFNKLGELVDQRFINKGKLKTKIALNLKALQSDVPLTSPILTALKADDNIDVQDDAKEALINDLTKLVSILCNEDILKILQNCTLSELVKAISQFEGVVCRRVDELSYTVDDFRESFCRHHAADAVKFNLQEVIGDLLVRKKIMDDHGTFLRSRTIPINFILPNQAIAIRLCECAALQDQNLLIKLGTGQGKSVVIGLAALNEANKIKDNPKGKVLVFTSYDHLAKRDQNLGQNFFRKQNFSSVCISTLADVEQFNDGVKIIYAGIEEIDNIIRDIMQNLLNNKATPAQKAFIKMIYGQAGEDLRIILDEYDLLLYDLEQKEPFVTGIPKAMLDPAFVQRNTTYCPWLKDKIGAINRANYETRANLSTGKEYSTVPWYDPAFGFNLPVSVMRLRQLIARAKRVIGLSGTADQTEAHNLTNPLFFEIPSSQNPEAFGTVIQEGDAKPNTEYPYISRRQFRELEEARLDASGTFYHVSKAAVDEYCQGIIDDIKEVQEAKERDGVEYKRPVLIFADPFFQYKTRPDQGNSISLWNTLINALRAKGIEFQELKKNVSDAELQSIARSGKVTVTTIKNGRGADIRVSLDILEGLHVIIGTRVVNKRLLHQLIGRTGRMGRFGSYSVFTLGSILLPQPARTQARSNYYLALHELTRFFINKVIASGNCTPDERKNWLMFLTNVFAAQWEAHPKIKEAHAKAICGAQYENNVISKEFLN